jgi:hypothetical protein
LGKFVSDQDLDLVSPGEHAELAECDVSSGSEDDDCVDDSVEGLRVLGDVLDGQDDSDSLEAVD